MGKSKYWIIKIRKPPRPKKIMKWYKKNKRFVIPTLLSLIGLGGAVLMGDCMGYIVGLFYMFCMVVVYNIYKEKEQ